MLLNLIINVDVFLLNNFIFINILENVRESIEDINVIYFLFYFYEFSLFF